jgi:spoIIIJ-associated protein
MSDVPQQAGEFLKSIFESTGLDLTISVRPGLTGPVLDIDGKDAELLQIQTGDQVYGRNLERSERLVCDVRGFRATREAELQAMANLAAKRVRETGAAFTFEPMSANERRIIHLTLSESEDLFTESIGEGSDRKLRIALKRSPK